MKKKEENNIKMALKILYEDKNLLVCKKDANIAVESARIGQKDMVSEIRNYLMKTTKNPYVGVIHRLDQPVEGIIVFAKNQKTASEMSKQIREHKVTKKYLALLCGKPPHKDGICEDYILKDGKNNMSKIVSKDVNSAQFARLSYKTLKEEEDNTTLVEIDLETGRHHQIRVQMANMGCPLWGDIKYNEKFKEKRNIVPALCAYKLEFQNPETKKKMTFEIQPDNEAFKEGGKNCIK